MEVQEDFKELLRLLNKNKVYYVVVGGYALAFHGAPRYTGDIDIFIKPTKDNAKKVLKSLEEFGFGSLKIKAEDLSAKGKVVQLGVPPVRIDIITSLSGVSWNKVYANKCKGVYGGVKIFFIGKREFIRNKKTTSRKRDLADIEALEGKAKG